AAVETAGEVTGPLGELVVDPDGPALVVKQDIAEKDEPDGYAGIDTAGGITLPLAATLSTGLVVGGAGRQFAGIEIIQDADQTRGPIDTTVAAGSNGLNVATLNGEPTDVIHVVATGDALEPGQVRLGPSLDIIVNYTSKTATSFVGCTLVSGSGTLTTGMAAWVWESPDHVDGSPLYVRFDRHVTYTGGSEFTAPKVGTGEPFDWIAGAFPRALAQFEGTIVMHRSVSRLHGLPPTIQA